MGLHGGELSVFSKGEGRGSTFTLRMPCVCVVQRTSASGEEEALNIDRSRSAVSISSVRWAANRQRQYSTRVRDCPARDVENNVHVLELVANILVVDDSEMNRKMLCRMLRGRFGVCGEAEDGLVAVQMVMESM